MQPYMMSSACFSPHHCVGFLLLGLLPPTDDRPTTDDRRPTDRPPPRSELLLAPPLSFFYTHTRHTHVDSLTHTRQTHTRSLTVPFFYTHTRHTHVDSLTHTRQTHTRFCWQGQHFRLWTVPERVSGPPPLDAVRRSTWEPRGSFLLAGAALQALDGARARFGAPPLDAARRSTWEPRGSFLLAGAALQALDGARARFGASHVDAATRSTWQPWQGFCWQGQHFRLWTVPERVSGPPPPLNLVWPPPLLDAARRSTWEPRGSYRSYLLKP